MRKLIFTEHKRSFTSYYYCLLVETENYYSHSYNLDIILDVKLLHPLMFLNWCRDLRDFVHKLPLWKYR